MAIVGAMAPPAGKPRPKSPATKAAERATFYVYRTALVKAEGVQRAASEILGVSAAAVGQYVRAHPEVMDGLKRRTAGRPDGAQDEKPRAKRGKKSG